MKETKRMSAAQRRARQRKQRNRRIAMTVALVLVVALASIGGTIAWLTDSTDEVTNTFTAAGIDITLTETMNTDTDNDQTPDAWTAQLVPGKEYLKDPVVKVEAATDVDVYLFVKFEENAPAGKTTNYYLNYTSLLDETTATTNNVDQTWHKLAGVDNVWYRVVKTTDGTKSWHLLDGDTVTVKNTLTKNDTSATGVELKYTAYAIQTEGSTGAADAWSKINPTT